MTEPDFRLDRMPTHIADLTRTRREKEYARKARYESTERAKRIRAEYDAKRKGRPDTHKARKLAQQNRPFVIWDGEQPRDTGYSLFGNSEGMEICHPHLGTQECLDLLIETEMLMPDAIHCVFGGDFDLSWIVNDLSWRQLGRLKHYNATQWKGYEITHIPHKWWSVRYGKFEAKVYDSWSFFGSGLVTALEDWKIGPFAGGLPVLSPENVVMPSLTALDSMSEVEIVTLFKALRGEFLWKDIKQQRVYMRLELKYTKQLMERLRDIFLQAGYLPRSWHGPGALSRMAAQRHAVNTSMAVCPPPVRKAARFAYFGGRFTLRLAGHMKRTIFSIDWNSAYPYAATKLPNLAKGKWRFENTDKGIREALESGKFAVYNLTFWDKSPEQDAEVKTDVHLDHIRKTVWEMYPLPMRSPDHSGISYPFKVTGWYWGPEAELVMDDHRATFHGVWIFDEDDETDRPLAWMNEYYHRRLLLKNMGDPAEYTFKIIINGWYGQCAQRVGWDKVKKQPPKSHQLEWAGWITSYCRAGMWRMKCRIPDSDVISIDTDGIMSLSPIPLEDGESGTGLGQWKTEVYEDAVVWQSGVYGLYRDGEWMKAKTRGIPKGKYKPEDLVRLVAEGAREFTVQQPRFIGYGAAFQGQYEKLNVWVTEPQTYTFGGDGATTHRQRECHKTCDGSGIHRLKNNFGLISAMEYADGKGDNMSAPHFLPWEDNSQEMTEHVGTEDDYTYYFIGSDDI